MDLDDLLEDLLEDAWDRVRHGGPAARRTAAAVGGATAAVVAAVLALIAALVTDGAVTAALLGLAAVLSAAGIAALLWGWRGERRRRPARGGDRRGGGARPDAAGAEPDLRDLPGEVREDWRRLGQARALVGELAADGWVEDAALAEVDEHTEQLRKVLVTRRRAADLGGGRSGEELGARVADLADLLVALADEAVAHQVDRVRSHAAPATLDEARVRMAALRAARREVEAIDGGHAGEDVGVTRRRDDADDPGRRPGTSGSAG